MESNEIQKIEGQQPPPPDDVAKADRDKKCNDEFDRYAAERESLVKSASEAEKNFDTLLVTLSTLAIGSSFTLLNGFIKSDELTAYSLLVLAWLFLGACLFFALTDRLLTYQTHQKWLKSMDAEFDGWKEPGAWLRLNTKYDEIFGKSIVPKLKWVGGGTLLLGIIFLMLFIFENTGRTKAPVPNPTPVVIVNVYGGTASTLPSTRPTP